MYGIKYMMVFVYVLSVIHGLVQRFPE